MNKICIIGVQEEQERKGQKNYLKTTMVKISPNLRNVKDIQVQETQRVPNKMNPKRNMLRHIIIKMVKYKERILKTEREKQIIMYMGNLIRVSKIFLAEVLQARRE